VGSPCSSTTTGPPTGPADTNAIRTGSPDSPTSAYRGSYPKSGSAANRDSGVRRTFI
jgi:hypothetical protein